MPRTTRPIAIGLGLVGLTGVLAACSGPANNPGQASYSDGVYEGVGNYLSPGGPQHVSVLIRLKNDHVTNVFVTPGTFLGDPGKFQNQFAAALPDIVLGMDIDLVAVSRVAGSSLTSTAFNQAVEEIKTKAREPQL